MDPKNRKNLELSLRLIAQMVSAVYEGATGEPLALDKVIRRYPLVALGLAAGTGAALGLWWTRRSQPQLPAPRSSQIPLNPLDYLEAAIPAGLEKAKELVPDDPAGLAGRLFDSVVEPKIRDGLDAISTGTSDGRIGDVLRQAIQRGGSNGDHEIPDPEDEQ